MSPEERDYGSRMFAALANPARLQILEYLSNGPASVNAIASATDLKQSMTSQHLASLLASGVVVYEKIGNSRLYSLRGPRIARILGLVREFYQAHLQNLQQVLAQSEDVLR